MTFSKAWLSLSLECTVPLGLLHCVMASRTESWSFMCDSAKLLTSLSSFLCFNTVLVMFERLESRFHYPTAVLWSRKYWVISVYASIIYVITIFAIQRWMRDRKPYDLRRWLFSWSLMLSLFSMLGFYHTGGYTRTGSKHLTS